MASTDTLPSALDWEVSVVAICPLSRTSLRLVCWYTSVPVGDGRTDIPGSEQYFGRLISSLYFHPSKGPAHV